MSRSSFALHALAAATLLAAAPPSGAQLLGFDDGPTPEATAAADTGGVLEFAPELVELSLRRFPATAVTDPRDHALEGRVATRAGGPLAEGRFRVLVYLSAVVEPGTSGAVPTSASGQVSLPGEPLEVDEDGEFSLVQRVDERYVQVRVAAVYLLDDQAQRITRMALPGEAPSPLDLLFGGVRQVQPASDS